MPTDPQPEETPYSMTCAMHNDVMDRALTENEPTFEGEHSWRRLILVHFYHVLRSEGSAHAEALYTAYGQALSAILDENRTVLIP